MKEDFQNIASLISPKAKLISADILPGGYSSDVYILNLVEGKNKKKVVLRSEGSPRSENRISTEYHLINCLKGSNLPLPEAIHIDVSLKYFPKPFMIMSFIDGKSFEPDQLDISWMEKVSDLLNDIRSIEISNLPKLPIRIDPLDSLLDYLPDEKEWRKVREYLKSIGSSIFIGEYKFLHGDFWPGNILWKNDEIIGLIDWEYAAIGDPMSDIAVASLELRYKYGEKGAELFQTLCSNYIDIDSKRLSLWLIYVSASTLRYIHEWRLPKERQALMIREAKAAIHESFSFMQKG